MTGSTSSTFKTLLSRFGAFSDLDEDRLAWLAERAQPFHCSVGQQLLVSERLPEYCYCIVEGRGRVLHSDPALRRPVTLAYAQPGDLIGWAGLARRSPCEWITAATPLKLIGFSADTFFELERSCDAFAQWLDRNNSPAELMAVLEPALRNRPCAEPQEREVLRRLLPAMTLLSARQLRHLPDDGAIWLWNAQPAGCNVPVGQPVDSNHLVTIPVGEPLRLLRVDAERWHQELRPPLEAPPDQSLPAVSDLWSGDRYADLLAPEPQGERQMTAQVSIGQSDPSVPPMRWRGRKVPVVTGIGPLEQTMACLEMLALVHNVPFRRDVLERAAREGLRDHAASLEILGNLSTLLGFVGTISDIPTAQLPRLAFPCFALVDGQLAMVHDISRGQVRAVLPEYGPLVVPLAQVV